jgi:hypothetical protein
MRKSLDFLNAALLMFAVVFSREATFYWFVILVVGMMSRRDHLGVTSVVRSLGLDGRYYDRMIKFFRSEAWDLDRLNERWCQIVGKFAALDKLDDRIILIGDGVKKDKEGRYMPGVKRLAQESETVSKPQYIFGHMIGAIGVLICTGEKRLCLPLILRIQDGVKEIFKWSDNLQRQHSHVVETVKIAFRAANSIKMNGILLLDAYFLTTKVLLELQSQNAENQYQLQIVTRAKSTCTAFREPLPREPGQKGRPRVRGEKISLKSLFYTEAFLQADVQFYDNIRPIQYRCIDLLWGIGVYQKLRFVLTVAGDSKFILVSTDLSLDPLLIIELYCRRFRIEHMFREMKQTISGFSYHFWSKSMPKLNHYRKKTDPDPLTQVTDENARKRVSLTLKAIEGYILICSIAMGLLQMIALMFSQGSTARWLRTYRSNVWSEATLNDYLQFSIFHL